MHLLRPLGRAIRSAADPIKRWVRLRRDQRIYQRSVDLSPEDRTPKRRRMHVLVDLLNEHGPKEGAVVVEVGVRYGETTAHLLKYCPQIEVLHGVDIVRPDPARSLLSGLDPRFHFILAYSHEAAKGFADDSVDLVFIDADHREEAVWQDLNAWFRKVKPGGILSGHDYESSHDPGVKAAVDRFFKENRREARLDANKVWWTFR